MPRPALPSAQRLHRSLQSSRQMRGPGGVKGGEGPHAPAHAPDHGRMPLAEHAWLFARLNMGVVNTFIAMFRHQYQKCVRPCRRNGVAGDACGARQADRPSRVASLMAERGGWEWVRCDVIMWAYPRMTWRVSRGRMELLRSTTNMLTTLAGCE
jgi:hypothetical protein